MNMAYCRFQNTAQDLRDCEEHIEDDLDDSPDEARAPKRLVKLCREIVANADLNE